MNKIIALNDKKFFKIFIGKRVLKSEIFNSKGTIPLYSANVNKPFGFLEISNIDDFSHDYVLWGIDGEFGLCIRHKEEKFATTDHCGAIEILDTKIMPEYLMYQLELAKNEMGFDRSLRSSLTNMENVIVSIPVTKDDIFDVESQKKATERFTKLKLLKQQIVEIKEELIKIQVEISEEEIGRYSDIGLDDENLFSINNGERITKKDIEKAKGSIPVYSASIFEDEALGYVSDNIKNVVPDARYFEGVNLTINADGTDYSVFVRKNKFYANDVCNVITIIDPNIDAYFLRHELLTQILMMGLDYSYKLYKKKLKRIRLRIPVNTDGEFDLPKQKKIAKKHEIIYQLKSEVNQQLSELGMATISV